MVFEGNGQISRAGEYQRADFTAEIRIRPNSTRLVTREPKCERIETRAASNWYSAGL